MSNRYCQYLPLVAVCGGGGGDRPAPGFLVQTETASKSFSFLLVGFYECVVQTHKFALSHAIATAVPRFSVFIDCSFLSCHCSASPSRFDMSLRTLIWVCVVIPTTGFMILNPWQRKVYAGPWLQGEQQGYVRNKAKNVRRVFSDMNSLLWLQSVTPMVKTVGHVNLLPGYPEDIMLHKHLVGKNPRKNLSRLRKLIQGQADNPIIENFDLGKRSAGRQFPNRGEREHQVLTDAHLNRMLYKARQHGLTTQQLFKHMPSSQVRPIEKIHGKFFFYACSVSLS